MIAKNFEVFIEGIRLFFWDLNSVEDARFLFSHFDEFLGLARKARCLTLDQYSIARDLLEDAFKERCFELSSLPSLEV